MTSHTCSTCGRIFSRRSSLRNHVKTHDDEVDRILREISEELNEGMAHDRLVELNDDEPIEMELSDSEQQSEQLLGAEEEVREEVVEIEVVVEDDGEEEEEGEEEEDGEEESEVRRGDQTTCLFSKFIVCFISIYRK